MRGSHLLYLQIYTRTTFVECIKIDPHITGESWDTNRLSKEYLAHFIMSTFKVKFTPL